MLEKFGENSEPVIQFLSSQTEKITRQAAIRALTALGTVTEDIFNELVTTAKVWRRE